MRSADPALPPLGKLLVATDGRTVQEIPLTQGRIIVGRTADNDLQIDSRFVSRHHCQITTSANSCVVEDLNSTNGIYVKSRRVRRHYLNDTVPGIPVLQPAEAADSEEGEEVETAVGLETTRDQS